jgi:Uma2 family endonuclease
MAVSPHHQWTLDQYVEHEKHTDIRHEYIDGQIYAMSGRTIRHAHISGNVFFALKSGLRGSVCVPFNTDAGVSAQSQRKYFYPDVSVVCGEIEIDPALPERIANPIMLIEVLSDGTEDYDRTTKFNYYKLIHSLQDYLIVEQDRPHITHYTRRREMWVPTEYKGMEAQIPLPSINFTLLMTDVSLDITWDGVL